MSTKLLPSISRDTEDATKSHIAGRCKMCATDLKREISTFGDRASCIVAAINCGHLVPRHRTER